MKRRTAHLVIAMFSAFVVGFAAVVDLQRTSPGPLTAVHQREPDLAGRSGCSDCHGGLFSNMTDSCLECHEDVGTQIEINDGLHGTFGKAKADQCAICHSEHHGEGFAMVNRQTFAHAGVKRPGEFDHDLVGFQLDGAHLGLACTECHEHAADKVLEKGTKRFLGLDQDCKSCHEDPHEGRMSVSCASCHGQSKWDELFSLGHEKHLPLIGGHGDVECRACHAENEPHSLESFGDGKSRLAVRTCAECHESPHATAFATGVAALASMPVETSCVTCHVAEHETFRDERLTTTQEQHARSGFPLEIPHDHVACADCHDPRGADFAARYPGRPADKCVACHDDPHGGQFAEGPFSDMGCVACHAKTHFEPHAFTLEKHDLAALPLTGSHITTECNECHTIAEEGAPRTFRGTPVKCEQCHADAHEAFFAPFVADMPEIEAGECARCHLTTKFAEVPASHFDHERWTDFAIAGAHAQSGCESCHPLASKPDGAGRTFGRVSEAFGDFEGCVTCHRDPHQGGFDHDFLPAAVEGRRDCARCHVETSFRALPHGFDHARWTGFALVGAHDAKCSACHAQMRKPDDLGRTWGRAFGPNCSDCHDDPHGGQFDEENGSDCSRCHSENLTSFSTFDHDRDSQFPLSDAHARLECSACHLPVVERGQEFIRYRPLGTECVDCHGVHEEVLLRRTPRRK